MKFLLFNVLSALLFLGQSGSAIAAAAPAKVGAITVFVAERVITMEPSIPTATAVAVADGRIVSVGSLESLKPWMANREVKIDTTFKDKVLMPGFIDPHVHPSLPAIVTQFPVIAPDDWQLPTGWFPGALNEKAYLVRLQELVQAHLDQADYDPTVPFISWGYHPLWHGDIYRDKLDKMFPQQAVMLWHRSFHELVANTAALKLLNLNEQNLRDQPGINWENGHFWEHGAQQLVTGHMAFLFTPERYGKGMRNFTAMLHHGGVTSAMDMGTGIFGNAQAEMKMIQQAIDENAAPSRIVLTPIISDFLARGVSPQQALREVEQWQNHNSDRVAFERHFKLMLDGAIFSGLAQFQYPGYMDGHQGVWLAPFEESYKFAEAFWDAGYQIHAHTNGDKSTERLIAILQRLQLHKPRTDHRTTLEHFAYATEDQLRQLGDLGVGISANPYYQYILADMYTEKWLGADRARNMVPLGAAERAGVAISLHSDSPMAPLRPLTLAWAAVNRVTINGIRNNESQKLTVDQALRAITINAARVMSREHEIGSIRAGKLADFVVLDQDPYQVDPARLKDIKIWGTVFEGVPFALQ